MTEQLVWEAEVRDKASAVLKEIAKQADEATKGVDGLTKGASENSDSMELAGGSVGKMGAAMGVATAAAGVAVVAIGAVTVGVGALYNAVDVLTSAYEEQDAVERQLAQAFASTGLEGEALKKTLGELADVTNHFANSTNFSDEQVMQSMATLQDLSPAALDAAQAQEAMSVVLGIAARRKVDADKAAKLYAKGLQGEANALRKVLPLTRDQARELDKVKDESERTAKIQELLAAQYAGSAESVTGFFRAQKNLQDALGDSQQALGQVIVQSQALDPIIMLVEEGFRSLESAVKDNAEEWGQFLRDVVAGGVGYLVRAMEIIDAGTPYITAMATTVRIATNAWQIHFNIMTAIGKGIVGLATKFYEFTTGTLAGFIGKAAEAADVLGLDLADSLKTAEEGLKNVSNTMGDISDWAFDGVNQDITDIATDIGDIVQAFEDAPAIDGKLSSLAQGAIQKLESVRAGIESVQRNSNIADSVSGSGGARPTAELDTQKAVKETNKYLNYRNAIAATRLGALRSESDLTKLQLERSAQQLELQREIAKGAVTDSEARLQRTQIQYDYEAALEELRDTRMEERKAKEEEAHQRRLDMLDAELEKQQRYTRTVANSVNGIGDGAFSTLITDLQQVNAEYRKMAASSETASAAMSSAISSGGSAVGSVLDAMGLGFREVAGIRAAFEQAAAFAALGAGNLPGFAAHQAAAVGFGAVALGAGGSGESAGGAGGGATQTRQSQGMDYERAFETQKRAYIEAIRETQVQDRGDTYVITGNTFLERNLAAQRDLVNTLGGVSRRQLALA